MTPVELHAFDTAATAWLQQFISGHGWPSSAAVGRDGQVAPWLIAQHSPDLLFQKRCLALLLDVPSEEMERIYTAFLWDRVCVREGRPQGFGTQLRREPGGEWQLFEMEAPERVDERRAHAGLEPLADYLRQFQ